MQFSKFSSEATIKSPLLKVKIENKVNEVVGRDYN
jgi:hypothetical protein